MVERNKSAGACAGGGRSRKMEKWMSWMIKIIAAYVVVLIMYLTVLTECQARLPQLWPTGHPLAGGRADPNAAANSVIEKDEPHRGPPALPPRRDYKSNGYLMVSSNGGLNQMRAGICDMVAIARYLNLTLVVPELDKRSFWADQSDFGDIFDVKHFIDSLRDEVKILKSLPNKFDEKVNSTGIFSMPPVSWSNESYYLKMILPLIRKHRVVHFLKTDSRLANNGLPVELQRLRCRVNYKALRFTQEIEVAGDRIISTLRKNGLFVALHLRYEMDMLSFTGCSHGCSDAESDELTNMRYANPVWKEKGIDSKSKRLQGICPLTPEEIALVLQGLGIQRNTQIYVASGEIYGGERRMAVLKATYPKFVSKEMLLTAEELISFQNHSSRMAAVDYVVSVASDIFIPSHDGNMGRLVEGHRRYNGFRKTIQLDKKMLVELIDLYQDGKLSLVQFSSAVMEVHRKRMGLPTTRNVIPRRPKEEDYFYANPEECLNQPRNINTRWKGYDI